MPWVGPVSAPVEAPSFEEILCSRGAPPYVALPRPVEPFKTLHQNPGLLGKDGNARFPDPVEGRGIVGARPRKD